MRQNRMISIHLGKMGVVGYLNLSLKEIKIWILSKLDNLYIRVLILFYLRFMSFFLMSKIYIN